MIIKENKIRCKICGDIIESTFRHDFKECSCGACFVDGGHAYLRRGWNPELGSKDDVIEEMSITENDDD